MNFKKLATGLSAALWLSLAAGAAQAQLMRFEDDDIEFVLNADMSLKTSGVLAPGDVLVSVFEIPTFTIDGVNAIPAGQELTGVSAVQIEAILGNTIIFDRTDVGLNAILDLGGGPDVVGGEPAGGATIAMFFNAGVAGGAPGDPGFSDPANLILDQAALFGNASCLSLADCISDASPGTLVQVDGFGTPQDLDAFWQATVNSPAGLSIDLMKTIASDVSVGSFNAAQETFFNLFGPVGFRDVLTGQPCAPAAPGCIQGGVISGGIQGGAGLTNGAFAHTDFQAGKLLAVPEPGALLLLGAGLIALVGFRRRS